MPLLAGFVREDDGATAIEYGMIASLIVIVIISSVGLVASKTTAMWTVISSHM